MLHPGYQIRYHIAAILAAQWAQFVLRCKQWIRPVVFENVRKVLACRTPVLGCHVYRCDGCGHRKLVPHSCKSRLCPTCGKHATDVWSEQVLNNLLDVPYHHIVMSIPWQLRIVIAMNRKKGLNLLVRAATESIAQWARDVKKMRMGIRIVLHTFGSDLKWHPHVHLIVTGGGLSLDGKQWIRTDPRFLMPHGGLKKRWTYHVIRLMKKGHREGQWRFPQSKAFLKEYRCFAAMLNKLWHLTWYAFIGASLLDPRFSVRYIGRYTKRAVLAEYRITFYDEKLIRFRFRDYAKEGKTSYVTLKIHTFIHRLIRHVPDKHFSMIRYAGLFCNRWKARYIALATAALNQPDVSGDCPVASPSWAERQTEYTGVNPLVCPNCQQPMKHVAYFFGSWQAVQIVFAQSGRDDWIASVLRSPG